MSLYRTHFDHVMLSRDTTPSPPPPLPSVAVLYDAEAVPAAAADDVRQSTQRP